MSWSRTRGTTQIISWSLVASAALPWGITTATLGGTDALPWCHKPGRKWGGVALFADLCKSNPKPPTWDVHRNGRILEATWKLVNMRVAVRRNPTWERAEIQRLGHQIKSILKAYHKQRVKTDGTTIKYLLKYNPLMVKEAWIQMNLWYKAVTEHALLPVLVTTKQVTVERVTLYHTTACLWYSGDTWQGQPPPTVMRPLKYGHTTWQPKKNPP